MQVGNPTPEQIEEATSQHNLLKWIEDCQNWYRKKKKFYDELDLSKNEDIQQARQEFRDSMKHISHAKETCQ